jgi:hypothetical protein
MRICFSATGRWAIRTDGRTAVDSLLPKEVKFNGFTKQFTLEIRATMPQLSRALSLESLQFSVDRVYLYFMKRGFNIFFWALCPYEWISASLSDYYVVRSKAGVTERAKDALKSHTAIACAALFIST